MNRRVKTGLAWIGGATITYVLARYVVAFYVLYLLCENCK